LSSGTQTLKRTSQAPPLLARLATRSIVSTSDKRPASFWQATPGGTVTHFAHAAKVSAKA